MIATESHPIGHSSPIASALRTIRDRIDWRFTRAVQYAALEELDDHLLEDIGLTREDVRRARWRWLG